MLERFLLRQAESAYGERGKKFVKKYAPSLFTRDKVLIRNSSTFVLSSFAARNANRLSIVAQLPLMMEVHNSYSSGRINLSGLMIGIAAYKAGKELELRSEKKLKKKQVDFDI